MSNQEEAELAGILDREIQEMEAERNQINPAQLKEWFLAIQEAYVHKEQEQPLPEVAKLDINEPRTVNFAGEQGCNGNIPDLPVLSMLCKL